MKYAKPMVVNLMNRCSVTFCALESVMLFSAISRAEGGENGRKTKCAARTVVLKELYSEYPTALPLEKISYHLDASEKKEGHTQSVPCTAYVEYPNTSVMRVLNMRAVSSTVQLMGGADEKTNPGSDGTITL